MDDLKISEMLRMQEELYEIHKDGWEERVPENGHLSILWAIDEIGEMIAIIKKKGASAIMENESVRAHFTEEISDVFMYLFDMMHCYGISAGEFSGAYLKKSAKNMKRTWDENESLYEDENDD